jgi:hypothetical protein
MNARTRLEALHAEMLGDLQEVHLLLQALRSELPEVAAKLKGDAGEAASAVNQACVDFQAQAFALAEFIKLRKSEVLEDIQHSTARNATTTKRALSTFSNMLWALAALGLMNFGLILYVALHK